MARLLTDTLKSALKTRPAANFAEVVKNGQNVWGGSSCQMSIDLKGSGIKTYLSGFLGKVLTLATTKIEHQFLVRN